MSIAFVKCLYSLAVSRCATPNDPRSNKKEQSVSKGVSKGVGGAPGETRTPDPLLRRQTLYPTELRAHGFELIQFTAFFVPIATGTSQQRGSLCLFLGPCLNAWMTITWPSLSLSAMSQRRDLSSYREPDPRHSEVLQSFAHLANTQRCLRQSKCLVLVLRACLEHSDKKKAFQGQSVGRVQSPMEEIINPRSYSVTFPAWIADSRKGS